MKKRIVFALFFLFFAGVSINTRAVPPGKDASPLEVKEIDAKLVLVGMSKQNGKLVSAEFAWIPKSSEKFCFGKALNGCREKDHERTHKSYKGEAPTQVLLESVTDSPRYEGQYETLFAKLSGISFVDSFLKKQNAGDTDEIKITEVERSKVVKARVRWELWSNGENFRILEIIK